MLKPKDLTFCAHAAVMAFGTNWYPYNPMYSIVVFREFKYLHNSDHYVTSHKICMQVNT